LSNEPLIKAAAGDRMNPTGFGRQLAQVPFHEADEKLAGFRMELIGGSS
jgi:hypothetical protein